MSYAPEWNIITAGNALPAASSNARRQSLAIAALFLRRIAFLLRTSFLSLPNQPMR